MAYENEQSGSVPQQQGASAGNGGGTRVRDHLKAATSAAGEHLRAARTAASEAARARSGQASEWAKSRSNQASGWARTQFSGLQGRVQADPARATAWALGIGLLVGVVLSGLVRRDRSEPGE